MRMTEEQYAARQMRIGKPVVKPVLKAPKPPKYYNKKTWYDVILFDSQAEAERYAELKLLEWSGRISNLCLQVKFELAPSVRINGRKRPPLRYFADFTYLLDGKMIVEDVKGSKKVTEGYRIKRHLMKSAHGIDILETRK